MSVKNKSKKKSKASANHPSQQHGSDQNSGVLCVYTSIIQGVVAAGYSVQEAESAYDKWWSQGGDVDNVDLTVARLIRSLRNQDGAKPSNQVSLKKLEFEIANPVEKELCTILGLPAVSNVLNELVPWYNRSSTENRKLLTSSLLRSFYQRILQQKAWSISSSMLSSFFQVVYNLPSEVSNLLASALETLQKRAVDLPLSLSECLSLFETLLENISSATHSSVIQLANLWELQGEANKAANSVEGDDPKSLFMRRDNLYKAVTLRFDAFSLIHALSESELNESLSMIDLPSAIHTPANAEQAIKESEAMKEEVEQMRAQGEEVMRSLEEEVKQHQMKVDELTARRDALRKELELVERQLSKEKSELQNSQGKLQESRKTSQEKLASLEKKNSTLAIITSQAVACKAVEEAFDAVQKREAKSVESMPSFASEAKDESQLLQEIKRYLESEVACVSFLQKRSAGNQSEADALAAELQRENATEEKLSRIAKLRRSIAGDREAMNTLTGFAAKVEARLSAMMDGPKAEVHKEVLVPIYVLLFQLQVPKTITVEVYNVLADAVNAALPKPEPKPKPKPVEKAKEVKEEVKEKVKKPVRSGKKWGVIKHQEVKSVDAIREEIQASRHFCVCCRLDR